MVMSVVETGATPAAAQQRSRCGKNLWNKVVDVMCFNCSGSRRKNKNRKQSHPLSQLQLDDTKEINWSTSTLGMETNLNMNMGQGPSMEDARDIPLSSMPWYPPPPSPALLPSSRGSRRRGNVAASATPATATAGEHAGADTRSSASPAQRQGRRRPKERNSARIDSMHGADRGSRRDSARINNARRIERDRDWEYQTYGAWIIF
ncbi:hypothetical protein CLAIMM_02596 [Cladophialophora immunda]|nr:hypothetical protein CLAIMM_02596 [Cladophialophora immunda]